MERWARGAAGQAGHGATASSLLRAQLLLDLLQPRALLEAAHAIDHAWGHVSPDTGLAPVGIDGENVGSASQRADHHPAAVVAEGDILHLQNRRGMKPPRCAPRVSQTQIWTANGKEIPHVAWILVPLSIDLVFSIYAGIHSCKFCVLFKMFWDYENKPCCKVLQKATRSWCSFQTEFCSKKSWEIVSIACFVFACLIFRDCPKTGKGRDEKKRERSQHWAWFWQILAQVLF